MSYAPLIPRARLGFIIPSSNRMAEPQFQRFAPSGVVPHFARIGMTGRHRAPLDQLMGRIADAADLLADAKCDVTILQCTGTSMSGGLDGERAVIETLEKVSGGPAITTSSALMTALRALGANRIVFASETAEQGHAKKLAYLREVGLDVIADKSMGLENSDAYCTTPPEFWFDAVKAMRNDKAEAYFISCANIHSIDVIEKLEEFLDRPVITSNQVALWCALRIAGIKDRIAGLGHLGRLALPETAQTAE